MRRIFSSLIFAASLGSLSATPVLAQSVLDLDTNGDHAISVDEASAALDKQFAKLDTNGDGVVDKKEYVDARLAELGRMDSDNDGEITRSELRAQLRSRFMNR